jgi:hypothetical protein
MITIHDLDCACQRWHVMICSNHASIGVKDAVSVTGLFCMADMTTQYEHSQAFRMQIGFAGLC